MRCNPWRWLWGIIPIAMLSWLAFTWERDGIETELRASAESALEKQGFGWGKVTLDGRDAMLRGEAPDDAQPYRAVETVRDTYGIRVVRHRTDLKRAAETARAPEPEAVEVERRAPAQAEETGRGGEGDIDRIRRAELEEAWRRAEEHEQRWRAERASPRAQALAQPEEPPRADEPVRAEEPTRAEGSARAEEPEEQPPAPAVEEIDRAELEKSWRRAEENEQRWRAQRAEPAPAIEPEQPEVGQQPSAEDYDRAALEETWRRAEEHEQQWKTGGEADRIKAAEGAARARADAEAKAKQDDEAKRAAEEADARRAQEARAKEEEAREQAEADAEAQRLANEQAAADAKRKADEDEARRKADAEAAEQRAAEEATRRKDEAAAAERRAAEEADAKRKEDVALAARRAQDEVATKAKAEAERCQGLMRSALAEGVINFATAKADLTRDSYLTLDRLAGIVKACPTARISIAGHTDSQGLEERNQLLSERRAKSVADYLIQKGVEQQRLSAAGYGETKPLAPNDTPEGMAQNRRIEFNVAPEQQ